MGDKYAVIFHQFRLLRTGINTVSHDCFRLAAEEAEPLISVAVKLRFGTELLHPRHFVLVFRQMGLHRQRIFPADFRQRSHQFVCTAGDKARRQNRKSALVFSADTFQPSDGIGRRRNAVFPQLLRSISVHIDLSYERNDPGRFHMIHENFRGLTVTGSENTGSRRSALLHLICENSVRPFRILRVAVFHFCGKRLTVQPFDELQIHRRSPEFVLRRVDMKISQPGHDQLSREVSQRQTPVFLRQFLKDAQRYPFRAHQITSGNRPHLIL